MNKIGLVSKHIVFTNLNNIRPRCPLSGIIFIVSDLIEDILILEYDAPFEVLQELYSEYELIDYSEYYISPGIIDLNARRE